MATHLHGSEIKGAPITEASGDEVKMEQRINLWCAWSGLALIVLFIVGLIPLAGFVPANAPTTSAQDIAAFYHANRTGILAGMFLCMIGGGLILVWCATLALQTWRASGGYPVLTAIQMLAGGYAAVVATVFASAASLAAFRTEDLAPDVIRIFNDFAWFWWLIPYPAFTFQEIACGAAILLDRRAQPLFPRWSGFLSIWCGILYVPGGLAPFFKTGPFAYNGLIVWYIPTVLFFVWIFIMTFLLVKAIKREA